MNIPEDVSYSKEHEWVRIDAGVGTIGITDYAQSELGDIVFVELPGVGTRLIQGKSFGTIEAVKAVSDLYAPVSGEVTEVNKRVQETPEVVNKEPYDGGWMVRVKLDSPGEVSSLLNAAAYRKLIGKS